MQFYPSIYIFRLGVFEFLTKNLKYSKLFEVSVNSVGDICLELSPYFIRMMESYFIFNGAHLKTISFLLKLALAIRLNSFSLTFLS